MGRQPFEEPLGSALVGLKKLLAGPAGWGGLVSVAGRSRSESTISLPFSTPFFTSWVIFDGSMSTCTDCSPRGDGTLDTWYQPRYQPRARKATVAAPTMARMFRMVGSFSDRGIPPGGPGGPRVIPAGGRAVQRGRGIGKPALTAPALLVVFCSETNAPGPPPCPPTPLSRTV